MCPGWSLTSTIGLDPTAFLSTGWRNHLLFPFCIGLSTPLLMLKKSTLRLIPIQRFSKTLECLLLLHFTCKIYVQIYINHYSCGTWIFAEGEKQALFFYYCFKGHAYRNCQVSIVLSQALLDKTRQSCGTQQKAFHIKEEVKHDLFQRWNYSPSVSFSCPLSLAEKDKLFGI